ncbi:MAG: pilin [Patescibacteria group bacterium]|nr:pilin [Patescibacteria group bacterium]
MKLINNKKIRHGFIVSLLLCLIFCLFFINTDSASADNDLWSKGTLLACKASGDCQLNDFMQLAVNASGWLLGITGSLALLALVYGGVIFLISGGSSERVNKAKQIIIGAVIGVVIVFLSYTIIGFAFKALGIDVGTGNAWSNSNWFNQK